MIGRETHTPETDGRLSEFKFNISGHAAIVLRFNNLTDDFLLGLVIGEEDELAGREGGSKTDDRAVDEYQNGLSAFGKRLALV